MEHRETTRTLDTNRSAPEITQAMAPLSPDRVSADAVLSDAEKRRQLEMKLAALGMSPSEVRRLLEADDSSAEPVRKPVGPASAPSTPAPRVSAEALNSYAAQLTTAVAAKQAEAVRQVDLQLPEFRESAAQEVRQAEQLLRDASMLRRRNQYAAAMDKCREALNLVPRDAAALELYGDLLQGVGRVDEALAAYKRALEADKRRASAEKKYADLLMRQQKWEIADNTEALGKNGYVAVMLSGLMPGAGQIYNGEPGKAAFFFVATVVMTYVLGWSPWGFAGQKGHGGFSVSLMASLVLASVLYLASLIDASIVAKAGGKRASRSSGGWQV